MTEIKIFKPEFIEEVRVNYELREAIAEAEFIQNNSVRMLAIKKSEKLTKYNILCVIKKFMKLKTIDEMFTTKKIVK